MNRTDLQSLARARLREAKQLQAAGMWPGAYYLAGYVVEFALKACIAKLIRAEEWRDWRVVKDTWTHDLGSLRRVAEVNRDMEDAFKTNDRLSINWATVKDWSEESRYTEVTTETDAKTLIAAIEDPQNGILPWLAQRW